MRRAENTMVIIMVDKTQQRGRSRGIGALPDFKKWEDAKLSVCPSLFVLSKIEKKLNSSMEARIV